MSTLDAQIAKLDSLKLANMITQDEYIRCKAGLLQPTKITLLPTNQSTSSKKEMQQEQEDETTAAKDDQKMEEIEQDIPFCCVHHVPRDWCDLVFSTTGMDGLDYYECSVFSPCRESEGQMGGTGIVSGIPPVENNNNSSNMAAMMGMNMMGMGGMMGGMPMSGMPGMGMPGMPPSMAGMPGMPPSMAGMPGMPPPVMPPPGMPGMPPMLGIPPMSMPPGMPPTPGMPPSAMGMPIPGMSGDWASMAPTIFAQPGDWTCQCGEFNQYVSTHCVKCGSPTETGTPAIPGTPIPNSASAAVAAARLPMMNAFNMMNMMARFHPYGGRGRGGMIRDFSKSVKAQPLPPDITEEVLKEAFEQFGPVEDVALKMEGTPAYGYVNFLNQESVAVAVAGHVVQIGNTRVSITNKGLGSEMLLGRGASYREAEPSNGIGLFRLSPATREEDIWMKVKHLGAHTVKMVIKDGGFAGYAFAYFPTVEAATAAKEELTGDLICGMPFDIKYAIKGRGPGGRGRGISRY